MALGRPTSYSPEVAEQICRKLVEGDSLRKICLPDDMPGQRTVYGWLVVHSDFAQQYAQAREMQAHTRADMASDAWETEDDVQRARLKFDALRWHAAKLLPKVYADRVDHEISGDLNVHRLLSEKPMTEDEWAVAHASEKPTDAA